MRYLPFLDLVDYQRTFVRRDLLAALAVVFVCVPQGLAYAIIAGLPPAMGLYAAAVPAIVGSLFRSSRHVVTGPTNALSLLVGSGVAVQLGGSDVDPVQAGVTLAAVVGLFQVFAGLLRLDVLVDYISHPVLRGYITGAAVLIAVGQLPNVTGTHGVTGNLAHMIWGWASDARNTNLMAVGFAVGSVVLTLSVRRLAPWLPGPILALGGSILLANILALPEQGLRVVGNIAATPASLPPFTVPSWTLVSELFPLAVACTVLSLVESTSSARALAARAGQRLEVAAEFTGQGLANLAAAFSGGYPVSGSLSRSVLNQQSGAETRLAGVSSGVLMLLVLLVLGPMVDETPLATLAGLLFVVATDLLDWSHIRMTLQGARSDLVAFVVTLLGTWTLSLDQAIYMGVGISLLLFLRRARLLTVREMAISEKGRFREVDPDAQKTGRTCEAIRIMNLTGPLFFAAAGELQFFLDRFLSDARLQVLILRLRQADAVDVTIASVLETTGAKLARGGKTLLLLGARPATMQLLERTGVAERLGRQHLFPVQAGWFTAMEVALRHALALAGPHACGATCPLAEYIAAQEALRSAAKPA